MLQFSVALMFYGRASRAASMLVEEQLGNIPVASTISHITVQYKYFLGYKFCGFVKILISLKIKSEIASIIAND